MQWQIVGTEATRDHLRTAGFEVVEEWITGDELAEEESVWRFFSALRGARVGASGNWTERDGTGRVGRVGRGWKPLSGTSPQRSCMSILARLWAARKRRPLTVALSVFVLAFFLAYPFFDWYVRSLFAANVSGFGRVTPFTFNDFSAFTTAVDNWYAGDPIYTKRDGGYHGSYLYPPPYLLLFVPFFELQQATLLQGIPFADGGFEAAAMAQELAFLCLLWLGLQFVVEEPGYELASYERIGLLWLLFGFQPVLFSFKWGQTAAFQAGVLSFAFVALSWGERGDGDGDDPDGRGRTRARAWRIVSGALTTVASGMKLFYATSGAHLLADRDRFLGAIAGLVGFGAVSLVVFGPGHTFTYWDVLLWGKGWGTEPIPPWLWGPTYYRPFYVVASRSPELAIVARVVGLVVVIALSLLARNAPADRETFALGVAAIPFFAPTAYTYDYAVLLPAVVILLAVELERDRGRPWLPVLAVWLLGVQAYGLKFMVDHLPAFLPAREAIVGLTPVLQPGLWGNLILLGLAAYRVSEHAAGPRTLAGSERFWSELSSLRIW